MTVAVAMTMAVVVGTAVSVAWNDVATCGQTGVRVFALVASIKPFLL